MGMGMVYGLPDFPDFVTHEEARGKPRVRVYEELVPGLPGVVARVKIREKEEAFVDMLRPEEREFYRATYVHIVFEDKLEGRIGHGQAAVFDYRDYLDRPYMVAVVHECFIYDNLMVEDEEGNYTEVPKREAVKRALRWCTEWLRRHFSANEVRISGHEPAVRGWEEILQELGFKYGYRARFEPVYILRFQPSQ